LRSFLGVRDITVIPGDTALAIADQSLQASGAL
jgi:hypothetical protein